MKICTSMLAHTCGPIAGALRRESGRVGRVARAFPGLVFVAAMLALASAAHATAAPAYSLQVYVGYADSLRPSGFFPTPWIGSSNTVSEPNYTTQSNGGFDSGAVRIDNTGTSSITVTGMTVTLPVTLSGGSQVFNFWNPLTIPAGQTGIFTQTTPYNFDSSDSGIFGGSPPPSLAPYNYGGNGNTSLIGGCSSSAALIASAGFTAQCSASAPVVSFSLDGGTTIQSFIDTGQVLNTGGWDFVYNTAYCPAGTVPGVSCPEDGNESINWNLIGSAASRAGTFSIGGTLSNLPAFGTIVLQDNGGDNLTLSANGVFTFATQIASGSPYNVTVLTQPAGQYCRVTSGGGTVGTINVTDVTVKCAPTTTYVYTGNGFKRFQCPSTPPPADCSAPGNGNSYTTNDSVTAGLTLAQPLSYNMGNPQDVTSLEGFQLTMSDGLNTVTVPGNRAACIDNCSHATAWVIADINGGIVAWYLDVASPAFVGGRVEIYSIYDPTPPGAIATAACGAPGCLNGNNTVEDYGSELLYSGGTPHYAYNLATRGSFAAPGTGGFVQLGGCLGTSGQLCSATAGASVFSVAGPNAMYLPPGVTETLRLCVVPADPRGPNCGASLSPPRLPQRLAVKDIPQCQGFGDEVIPEYLCGASGQSGTGFALIYGVGEQLNAQNGIYMPFKQFVNNIPALQSQTNPTCDALPLNRVRAVAIGGTRSNSLTEEQTPEQIGGRPLLTVVTSGCDPDPGPKGSGLPSHSIEGVGFKNLLDEPGPYRVLREVAFANLQYYYLNQIVADTDFTSAPAATTASPIGPKGSTLKACINKSQQLLNQGLQLFNQGNGALANGKFMCAAEQVWRCETLVDLQGQGMSDPLGFTVFKQSASSPLRLPDLWGDFVRRLGAVFHSDNYVGITAGNQGMRQSANWPTNVTNGADLALLPDPYGVSLGTSCPP
jgi:hypothetical protein